MPPTYELYDAQSHTSFETYFKSGEEAARYYWNIFRQHMTTTGALRTGPYKILEWGCGPARIIRHLPGLAAADNVPAMFYGTDYNSASIAWARKHVRQIDFRLNGLAPPLPFESQTFDFVYCRSVFTHLSHEMHMAWIAELQRILHPTGVLSLSTQGVAHRGRLESDEAGKFDRGELVIRARAAEGKLNYSAFHPAEWVRTHLLRGWEILRHETPPNTQEVWVVRKCI